MNCGKDHEQSLAAFTVPLSTAKMTHRILKNHHMDADFIKQRKTELLNERTEIKTGLAAVSDPDTAGHIAGDNTPKYPDFGNDKIQENSASPAESAEYALNVDVTSTLQNRLKEVEGALERIEKGTYGSCQSCEADINPERLKANAAAASCMACA